MISIIIPTFQEESVIENTLRPLAVLPKSEFEIIVSDNGSSDKTVEIARRYADKAVAREKDPRWTIPKVKNRGAEKASGEYLVFLDADCKLKDPAVFFREALSLFKSNPKLTGLTGFLKVEPGLDTFADRFFFGLLNYNHFILNNIFHIGSASGEFQMIPTAIFRKLGGYKEHLAASEDMEMFKRLSNLGITRIERHLTVLHTGRRAHKIGWPKLLSKWILNSFYMWFAKKSHSSEWEAIR